ncbi:MAG: hypothetical protein JNN28_09800 [Saprospiraceae bacterium]|nr:hypothetical protein [Saprospiraceae bacterium]
MEHTTVETEEKKEKLKVETEKLKAFQYRPFVKRVHILLPGYNYLHNTAEENHKTMVGRKRTELQFLNYLKKARFKGSYLITGYRGMGKTTLVNRVVDKYIDEVENTKKICISFGQKNITELDILKQIVYEIKNAFDVHYSSVIDPYKKLNIIYPVSVGTFTFLLLTVISAIVGYVFKVEIFGQNQQKFSELLLPVILTNIILSIGIGYLRSAQKRKSIEKNNISEIITYEKITSLYDRSISQFTSEESAGTGAENFPILLSRKKSKAYAIAGAKDISNELIKIIEKSNLKFVFIFDELDKIDTNVQQTYHYEDTHIQDSKGETFSFDDHRKRKRLILDILSSLKYLITEAKSQFIFIAGSEMFDAAMADVSDRHSAISSIFGHVINVDSLYKDKAEEGSIGVGITNLVERFLLKVIDPKERIASTESILKVQWCSKSDLSFEDKLKVMYTIQHFINYIAYRSTGSPKKLIKIIEEHTKTFGHLSQKDSKEGPAINKYKNIFVSAHQEYQNELLNEETIYLSLSFYDQYKFGLLNYFYRPIIISKSRVMKNYSDSLLVSIPYLMDHIHKFNGNAFSMESLELLPEVLSSGRNPELRMFMEDLIEQFKQNLIRGTETKFFDYKFNYKIYSEIVHVSTLFAEESSAYNFTLDENYNIKLYLRLKIKELRSIYKDFGGAESRNALDSIALYNTLLGDVTYYDREYSDAIGCYLDALNAMQNDDAKDGKQLSLNDFRAFSYLKCTMKLALCYEKIKSYDKAIANYIDVINVAGKIATVESKYFLREEINRYTLNAVFSCLFIYEKQPSLGDFQHLFSHVMSLDPVEKMFEQKKMEKRYWNKVRKYGYSPYELTGPKETDGMLSLRFRDFLIKEPGFLHHLGLLLFYRNTPVGDFSVVQKILGMSGVSIANDAILRKYNDALPIACINIALIRKFIGGENVNDPMKMAEVFELLKKKYFDKELAPDDAFFAARSLSRLGNLYYSSFFDGRFLGKKGDQLYKNKIKKDIKELLKIVLSSTITKNNLNILLSEARAEDTNSSDMIKGLLNAFPIPKFTENGFLEDVKISDIFHIYILSAKLYMYSGHSLMGSHLYRKTLSILRNCATYMASMNVSINKIKTFAKILKITLVRRCLQIASWNSSSTDRSQVYKYKHALDIEYIFHDKSIAKHNYKNTSNAPDVKEAIWHLIALTEICRLNGQFDPLNVLEDNPNQSFISQSSTVHTMYSRLNELDIQCVINKSLLKSIWPESSRDIVEIYKELRNLEDYAIEYISQDKKHKDMPSLKGKYINKDMFLHKENLLYQLPYLIANWIFCLHSMIQIIQTKGASYLFTFTTLADQYRRLGDVLKYYEYCRYLYKKDLLSVDVYELTQEMIGKDVIKSMDTTSLYQMATRNYRAAISAHNRGGAYRYMISNMYFLEDDFHDNLFHFSISFERHRINSGEIMEKLRLLSDEMAKSQFFDFDAHINTDFEWLEIN